MQVDVREPLFKGARPAQTRKRSRKPLRPVKASRVRFSGAPPISSLRSSTAEHPPDKRETVARHHAEGPNSKRCMAQTDEQRVENPQRWARYPLQRPFHRGIDVTATCLSSKQSMSVQLRHAAPNLKLSKCKSHAHRRAKAEDRGASPRESTISMSSWPT